MINALFTLRTVLVARAKTERGATAVEYGLMVALIAAVIIGVVALLGTDLREMFTGVREELGGAGGDDAAA